MNSDLSADDVLATLDRMVCDVGHGFELIATRLSMLELAVDRIRSDVRGSHGTPTIADHEVENLEASPAAVLGVDEDVDIEDQFAGHYDAWREARVEGLLHYLGTEAFDSQTVLEFGAGFGDLGAMLSERGAVVTCAEGRYEHVEVIRTRYPDLNAIVLDLDNPVPLDEEFDWVLHLGVLYHLNDPFRSLQLAASVSDRLILETEVTDSLDPDHFITVSERGYDQSLSGTAKRVSAAAVERMLSDLGYRFTRIDDPRFNADIHVYDWAPLDTGGWRHGLRRIWIAERVGAPPVTLSGPPRFF